MSAQILTHPEANAVSPEELISAFISLRQQDCENAFDEGKLATILIEHMGYTNETLSAEVNCSAEHIRQLTKTYQAFPEEKDRPYKELTWSHYRKAATSKNPHFWLEKAAYFNWSTREMAMAMRSEPVTDDEYRRADTAISKIKRILDEDNEVSAYVHLKLQILIDQYAFEKEKAG